MSFGKQLFALAAFCLPALATVHLSTQWVSVPNGKRTYDTPQNRTRPVIVGDIIYYADLFGVVTATHRTEGYLLWKTKVPGRVEGALAYGRSKVFVGDLQGNFIALNARDGSESWRFKIQAEWLSAPLILRDKVYAATSSDEVYALSETQGKEIWHFAHRGDEKMTVRGTSAPAVFGDTLFQGFSDGSLGALALDSGKLRWIKNLKSRTRFYDVDTTPVVDANGVVAATYDGKLYGLERDSGAIQWTFPAGAVGSALIEGNRLYVSGLDGNLYALDRQTSAVIWKTPFGGGVALAPTRSGDYLVVTTSSDPVFIVDPKTGAIVAKTNLGNGTLAGAIGTADGWFYTASNYSNLVSYRILNIYPKLGPPMLFTPSAVTRDFVQKESNREPS